MNRLGKTSAVNIMNVKEYLERYSYDGLDCGCLVEKFILYYTYIGESNRGLKRILNKHYLIFSKKYLTLDNSFSTLTVGGAR